MLPVAVEPPITPVTQECMVSVAEQLNLPVLMLYGVLYQEAGSPGRVSKNTNGTYDIGPMQINSIHLPFFRANYGLSEADLKNNGCLNVWAGGVLLWQHLRASGGDYWKAIGNYHSKTPQFHQKYQYSVASRVESWMKKYDIQAKQQKKPEKAQPFEKTKEPEVQTPVVEIRRY